MQTVNEIINDLNEIAEKQNYEGATVDAIIYLMASGIYKNQTNVINTALELSPSTCSLVNSAIQHAADKMYSVYRGRNQHILLDYAVCNENKSVKKYDVCTRIGKYKLLYARDYTFESGTRFNGKIELILCKDLIEETLKSTLKKYTRSNSIDITDDFDLYVNGEATDYVTHMDISLSNANYINQTCETPYLVLTDTDYGVCVWCYDGTNSDMVFDTNYSYSIKSPAYLTDTIEKDTIKTLPGFDITETLLHDDGITLISNYLREDNVDNIYIESSTAEHSGNIIRSMNDIKNIFLNYFAIRNIKSCKCFMEKEVVRIIYLLNDKNANIPDSDIEEFYRYLKKAYYVTQEIKISKAWAYKRGDYAVYKKTASIPAVHSVKVVFDSDNISETYEYEVNDGGTFELPNETYSKASKTFVGWRIEGYGDDYYAITDNGKKAASVIVKSDMTIKMVWADNENYDYRYIDIYNEKDDESSFYQRVVVLKSDNGYVCGYEPEKPSKANYSFSLWVNDDDDSKVQTIEGTRLTSDIKLVGAWNLITYAVKLYLTNEEIRKQTGWESDLSDNVIMNVNIASGQCMTPPDIPSEIQAHGYRLAGWYWCDEYEAGIGVEGKERYKFDVGTPITESLTLVAMYERDYDLSLEVYFDSPLNNTELHNFVEEYSYGIGETFEPMKVATQMSKKYSGISWINLATSKANVEIPYDAYYDFSYNISFNNDIQN